MIALSNKKEWTSAKTWMNIKGVLPNENNASEKLSLQLYSILEKENYGYSKQLFDCQCFGEEAVK